MRCAVDDAGASMRPRFRRDRRGVLGARGDEAEEGSAGVLAIDDDMGDMQARGAEFTG